MKVTLRSPNQPLKSPSFASYTSEKHIYVRTFEKNKIEIGENKRIGRTFNGKLINV